MSATEVAPGVWRAGSRFVNWYIVDAGDEGLTVIDGGLPAYHRQLDSALAPLGRSRADVRALVLTHGHIDHVGTADVFAEAGAQVYLHAADAALAANPRRNKTDSSVVPYLRWPATAAFIAHCVASGALWPRPFPSAVSLTEGVLDSVPGSPLVTHTPGHTDGSCVLEFRNHDVVFVGDLLCTASPRSGARAPAQLQSRASNRNSEQAMQSLERLSGIGAALVLPGHGGPWRDGVEAAVESARRIGCI